jgi:hypothetical protein
MEESILNTIKKMLGPDDSYEAFDTEIIVHINTALSTLAQLGVGPRTGFRITGTDETWGDFISDGSVDLEGIKTYIYMKVKMIFDPPANSFVMKAMEDSCKELEWRLNVTVDPGQYRA